MKTEKQLLIENIKEYAIILDDYINKRFKYTLNTEYLEDEIKTISVSLIEISNELENIILEENKWRHNFKIKFENWAIYCENLRNLF